MKLVKKIKFERRFMTSLMKKGQILKAEKILYKVLNELKTNGVSNPYFTFRKAFINITPVMSIFKKTIKRKEFMFLKYLDKRSADKLGIKWFLEKIGKQKSSKLIQDMEKEIILAAKLEGDVVKKKVELYKDVRFVVSKLYINKKGQKKKTYQEKKLKSLKRKKWF